MKVNIGQDIIRSIFHFNSFFDYLSCFIMVELMEDDESFSLLVSKGIRLTI